MIIQFQYRAKKTGDSEQEEILQISRKGKQDKIGKSKSEQKNTAVRIEIPKTKYKQKKKGFSSSFQFFQDLPYNQDNHISSNTNSASYFEPSISPKRTFGKITNLIQVIKKKVRAKTIEARFEQTNMKLGTNLGYKKGFTGGKLQNNWANKSSQKRNLSLNLEKKWMSYNSNKILESLVEERNKSSQLSHRYSRFKMPTYYVRKAENQRTPIKDQGFIKEQTELGEVKERKILNVVEQYQKQRQRQRQKSRRIMRIRTQNKQKAPTYHQSISQYRKKLKLAKQKKSSQKQSKLETTGLH